MTNQIYKTCSKCRRRKPLDAFWWMRNASNNPANSDLSNHYRDECIPCCKKDKASKKRGKR